MIKIGLTGSIGMGKSTVLSMFADLGAATWDADAAVHRLYAEGGRAVEPIGEAFPGVVVNSAIDRALLAGKVLNDPQALQKLEAIVHPLVGEDREAFLTTAAHAGAPAAVLDIPLLFENGTEKFFDATVVVSAPTDVQRERVLSRPGMSEEKLGAILALQMPDAEKRQKADYIIDTDQPIDDTTEQVRRVFAEIIERLTTA
ncbi:dephospho-CoA kinase [Hyphococcus flavus]|uniref:Dephospho-CoA kinase n=1 Tax=Hyphococcus flavus TaxID=1866326 RepID=A0AAE9ZD25_9PROT|nr:dephospho-CoA kinase [Hyphococcus flavus]WDI32753.1 dephospho-CoA kinase [Hyphococcus flavus]